MKHKFSRFEKVTSLLIVALLITNATTISAYFNNVYAALPTKWDTQGLESTANFIIYKDVATGIYYAKNTFTGLNQFSGTSASNVIQNATNTLGSGGKIYVSNGTYTLNTAITLTTNITFGGAGRSTILRQANGINGDVLAANGGNCAVIIQDLTIDGNKDNNPTGDNGISIDTCQGFIIQRIYTHNNTLKGIAVTTSSNGTITDNISEFNDSDGFVVASSHDIVLSNNIAQNNGAYGIGVIRSLVTDPHLYNIKIINNIIRDNTAQGISVTGTVDSDFSHNTIYDNGQQGIIIGSASDGLRAGRIIINGNNVRNNVGNGIRLQSTNNTLVLGNLCYDDQGVATQTYGIYENDANGGGNLIINNNCYGNSVNQIATGVTDTTKATITNNIGYTSTGTVVNQTDVTGQTAGGTGRCTYTTTVAGTYSVGGYITVTTINATGAVSFHVSFVDETNTVRTNQPMMLNNAGGISSSATSTGFFPVVTQTIKANATSTISIGNAFGAAATYNTGCFIQLISASGG